ncbi:hypothetical protein CW702_02945 [Candidatus Bathyarchaeota archaeon]|nr:MAG: hypothetical protein CW702_02945 [Candidatus Bathyarchaeota archaeon]
MIKSPTSREVKIGVICNDGVKVWLNRNVIIKSHRHVDVPPKPHAKPNDLVKETELRKGGNSLMIKVLRCERPVRLNVFIVDTTSNGSQGFTDLTNTYLPKSLC